MNLGLSQSFGDLFLTKHAGVHSCQRYHSSFAVEGPTCESNCACLVKVAFVSVQVAKESNAQVRS